VYSPGLPLESNVRGGQVCAKEVPKKENKVMKKRLLVVEIFFGIIMEKVNSAQNKNKQALKKIIFKMYQIKGPKHIN